MWSQLSVQADSTTVDRIFQMDSVEWNYLNFDSVSLLILEVWRIYATPNEYHLKTNISAKCQMNLIGGVNSLWLSDAI